MHTPIKKNWVYDAFHANNSGISPIFVLFWFPFYFWSFFSAFSVNWILFFHSLLISVVVPDFPKIFKVVKIKSNPITSIEMHFMDSLIQHASNKKKTSIQFYSGADWMGNSTCHLFYLFPPSTALSLSSLSVKELFIPFAAHFHRTLFGNIQDMKIACHHAACVRCVTVEIA